MDVLSQRIDLLVERVNTLSQVPEKKEENPPSKIVAKCPVCKSEFAVRKEDIV